MNRHLRLLTAGPLALLFWGLGAAHAAPFEGGRTTLVSVDTTGAPANRASFHSSISGDGRFVAFMSLSPYIVANDTNMVEDVFVRDRLLETTVRVSVDSTGAEANARSLGPEISGDGRYVTFISFATNLVANDMNGRDDVFRHDLVTGETILVSVSSTGVQQNAALVDEQVAISHDGDRVVFTSEATNLVALPVTPGMSQVYVREVSTGTTRLVSMRPPGLVGNGISHRAEISADGNHVTFKSYASNLVVQDTNGYADIFLAELAAQTVERVSRGDQGQQIFGESVESSVSGDGRLVVFTTSADNVVPNDTNHVTDVFLRDRATGTTQLLSRSFAGTPANNSSDAPVLSADGTHVVFRTRADDVVTGDANGSLADLILVQLAGMQMELLTVSTAGRTPNSHTGAGAPSSNGDFVAFHHRDGRRLAYGVFGTEEHVFVRDRTVEWPLTYCPVGVNSLGCVAALTVTGTPSVSAGSGFVLSSSDILNQQTVVLFYSLTGSDEHMWYAGTICLAQPWQLGPVTFSGGTGPAGTNCTGAFDIDVNTFLASGQAPAIGIGTTICAQAIHRDPGFHPSRGAVLTDAVVFRVGP